MGKRWGIVAHTSLGAVIGIVLLHPVTKVVYWFEFRGSMTAEAESLWEFLLGRLDSAFALEMLPMSLIFAFIGGSIGLGFGLYHLALNTQHRTVRFLEHELAKNLPSLIKGGEGEHLEFKASVRWDFQQEKPNRALEGAIAKTLSGFMNHRGGTLLVGISDHGKIVGLEHDYKTLRQKDRDGFERCITDIVKTRLGGDLCSFVHCIFYNLDDKDICRIIVEPSPEPVYLKDGSVSRYFLRTGNGTRELDAREALAHVSRR